VPEKPTSLAEIEAVYRPRGADFFRLALAKTGDPEAARDAVQDGFAQAIRSRSSYLVGGFGETIGERLTARDSPT
jgi:DNA-directed RNA polymerase specialized sigma24 family protein